MSSICHDMRFDRDLSLVPRQAPLAKGMAFKCLLTALLVSSSEWCVPLKH